MAQETKKEETEFKVPETLTLCVNNCGVTGNPATNNMCQKCFNATTSSASSSTASTAVAATAVVTPTATATTTTTGSGILNISPRSSTYRMIIPDPKPETRRKSETTLDRQKNDVSVAKREVNRCSGCRRKVGLTGFRCRCGDLFCSEHRYSDRHDCSFDYKSSGREAIARENPVVKAAKILRI